MASKKEFITAIYEHELRSITESDAKWRDFLKSACRNYKCDFDEQVLIHAQRPDATAVLEIEKWNKRFGRWVNRGAKGIAVFDKAVSGGRRLKYYFDIADTHESERSRNVPIWQMNEAYEADVIETLKSIVSDQTEPETLTSMVISASEELTANNVYDYTDEMLSKIK